jgi:acyl carrier protein
MNLDMPVVPSQPPSATQMRPEEEQGQRWLIVALVLVLGLQGFAIAERLAMGNARTIVFWLPFISLQVGVMCAAWLGHRWARWVLFLLLLREALLSLQLTLNFSNVGMVIAFAVYTVALCLVGLTNVGDFVRQQSRKHQMSTQREPAGLPEKAAFLSLMGPAIAVVILLSGQPVPRGGYDASALLGFAAIAMLLAGATMGIVGMFAASQTRHAATLRTAVAGTCLCGMLGGLWLWAAAGWPDRLEQTRLAFAQGAKHYLPIQTTVLQLEVADQIKVELGRILKRRPQEFDSRKPLMTQGLNDLQIVELVLAMERTFQVKVPDKRINSQTGEGSTLTIEQLADVIASEMKSKVSSAAYAPD